ncbi:MAG: signal peptidase I [Micrococcales bacterium]
MAKHGSDPQEAPSNTTSLWKRLKRNVFFAFLIDLVSIVGVALVLSLLVKTFLIRSFFIPSDSMNNTLVKQDRIIVNELVPNIVPLNRGDVVVFRDPGNWLGVITPKPANAFVAVGDWFLSSFGLIAPDSEQHLVKRVIGLPGDHITCTKTEAKIQINGHEITEPYLAPASDPCGMAFDVTVPAGKIWVMGDNRNNSADSRYHQELPSKGFVDKKYVVGRAFVLSWPFPHFKWLDNYPNVFKDVPKP